MISSQSICTRGVVVWWCCMGALACSSSCIHVGSGCTASPGTSFKQKAACAGELRQKWLCPMQGCHASQSGLQPTSQLSGAGGSASSVAGADQERPGKKAGDEEILSMIKQPDFAESHWCGTGSSFSKPAQQPPAMDIAPIQEGQEFGRAASAEQPVDMPAAGGPLNTGLYIILISMHGLVRGDRMELGKDPDTGGQVYALRIRIRISASVTPAPTRVSTSCDTAQTANSSMGSKALRQ